MGAVEPYSTCTILVERREWPEYRCSADQSQFGGTDCQRVRALALDRQVEERFLEALRPDHLTLALAALVQLEQEEQARSASSGNSGWSAHETSQSEPSVSIRQWSRKTGW